MLNAGARRRRSGASAADDNDSSTVSESTLSTLDDNFVDNGNHFVDDASLVDGADEERSTTPRQSNASNANDGRRENPFKLSVRQQDEIEEEEEELSPRTSVTQSNTGEVELGLRRPREKTVSFSTECMANVVENTISEDSYFCDEPFDRPPSQYQHHSVSYDSPTKFFGSNSRRGNGLDRKDSANFFLDDNDIEANPSGPPRSDRSGGSDTNNDSSRFRSMGGMIRQSMATRQRSGGRRSVDDSELRKVSLNGRNMMSTRLGVLIWESDLHDTYVEATTGKRVSIKIPSWSKQDRFKRALVIPKRVQVLLGSSIFLGLIFLFTYLLPESLRPPEGSAMRCSIALPIFILLQTFVTLITAIPGEDSTNKEINQRINASILIAMTLYPCLGLWIATRTQQLGDGNTLQTLGIDHLWNLHDDERGTYQWGYIFP